MKRILLHCTAKLSLFYFKVSELVLWDALLNWSSQECGRQSLELSPENQRKVLGDCFSMVR